MRCRQQAAKDRSGRHVVVRVEPVTLFESLALLYCPGMGENRNNFDLVRLAAASQVMAVHGLLHMGWADSWVVQTLGVLPGVPAFFFVSGFLISGSYERNPDIRQYARNRVLRIYPGLWGAVAMSLLLVGALYQEAGAGQLTLWAVAQSTVLQVWNPDFLRDYGVGVVNGALWTIPVELSFYIAAPLIYWLGGRRVDWLLALAAVVSFALLNILMALPNGSMIQKAGLLTPLPWFGMFACGVLAKRHFARLRPFVEGRFLLWLAGFVAVAALGRYVDAPVLLRGGINALGLFDFAALGGLVLAAAYTKPDLADRLLRRNDISYGLYILHMPIINALLEAGIGDFRLAMALTILAAIASWFLIEKPALRGKRLPARAV